MTPSFDGLSVCSPDLSLSGTATTSSYAYPDSAPLSQPGSYGWDVPSFSASRSLSPSPFSAPWSEYELGPIFDIGSSGSSDYTVGTSVSSPPLHGMLFDGALPELCLIDEDLQESAIIDSEVASISTLAHDTLSHATFWLLEDRYMPLFWSNFNVSFPILHPSSFFNDSHHPILVRALMVAAGATFGRDADARLVAAKLGRVCVRLLQARKPLTTISSLADMQMTFISEAISLYRTGRPMKGMSARFEAMTTLVSE